MRENSSQPATAETSAVCGLFLWDEKVGGMPVSNLSQGDLWLHPGGKSI
jgi:hypothetical protein